MSNYLRKFNPWTKKLQWVIDANLLKIKGSVNTKNDLPITGNSENDCYITKDTDRLYTWSISASSGTLDDWKDVGSTAEIDWSAITNKPSSSTSDIDDAVSKKHSQNTDTGTTENIFQIDSDNSGVKLRNGSGDLDVRNSANDDYADLNCKELGDGINKADPTTILEQGINYIFDGGGMVITTGIKGDIEIPFDCVITSVTILADQSGSVQIDIWKDTYTNFPPTDGDSITASAVPNINSGIKNQDTTLTGWTKNIYKGDILRFNIDSVTNITRCTISIKVRKI